ncbi:MAG: FAD binding domain-containing protein, partial [Alphaproteobacteria bacterium]|nr:FAD binding domain-containing protein [Alphaproteobacteria bacterium]
MTLLDWLREHAGLKGTKEGCAEGDCGACTVVLERLAADGSIERAPINACITMIGQLDGFAIRTVEGLSPEGGALHPVQAALAGGGGTQCGFCTPGFVMSAYAFAAGGEPREPGRLHDALAGNLCRCTGYRPIVDSALEVCKTNADDQFTRKAAARLQALRALDDKADVFIGDETSFFAAPASEQSLGQLYLKHPDATIVAGATDVGLWITKKLTPLEKIIHVGRVAELAAIEESPAGFEFGAIVSLARAAPVLGAIDPDVAEVMRRFGSMQVRAAGTVGGNIANGSPIGDLAPMLIALNATL